MNKLLSGAQPGAAPVNPQGNNLLLGGAPAPSAQIQQAFAQKEQQASGVISPAVAGVVGPSIVALLAEPKRLTPDDVTKAITADISHPGLSAEERKELVGDAVQFMTALNDKVGRLGDMHTPDNVNSVVREALQGLGAAFQQMERPPVPTADAIGGLQPEHVDRAHRNLDVTIRELLNLTSKPEGSLKRAHLYHAASAMMEGGAFPTRESRAQLMAELTNAPNDEASVRQMLGHHLGRLVELRQNLVTAHGPRDGRNG